MEIDEFMAKNKIFICTVLSIIAIYLFINSFGVLGQFVRQPHNPNRHINFQPTDSEVPANYLIDDGSTYNLRRGYGWDSDRTKDVAERNLNPDQRLDTLMGQCCEFDQPAIFSFDLPNGEYEVTVVSGDPAFAHPLQYIWVENVPFIEGESTSANQFITRTKNITIKDGQLNLILYGFLIDVLKKGAVINYIDIKRINIEKLEPPKVNGDCIIQDKFDGPIVETNLWSVILDPDTSSVPSTFVNEYYLDTINQNYHMAQTFDP